VDTIIEGSYMMTSIARLDRMFNSSGKCFDVAIDHGLFNESSFLYGITNMEKAIKTVIEAKPDCIQLSVGQAQYFNKIKAYNKPSLVLRTDIANVYGNQLPRTLFSELINKPVEQAVKLDAVAVCVNLLLLPNQPELHHQCVKNIVQLKTECEKYGMVLMVEPLVMLPNEDKGGYMVDGDINKIMALVRQAVELGTDVIKADPCDNIEDYHQVVEVANNIPILVRGGGKASDTDILKRTETLLEQGVYGIVYGRNVIQHQEPKKITRALMEMVHNGLTAEKAINILAKGDSA